MKYRILFLASALLAILAVSAMAGDKAKMEKMRVAPDDVVTGQNVATSFTPYVPTRVTNGVLGGTATVIGQTAYDYMYNSGGPQHIVTYNGITYMIFIFRITDAAGIREIHYVSYDGTNFLPEQAVIDGATQSTYFSGVDVFRGGIADGFGVVGAGWAGSGSSYFGIEAGPGQGNFANTLVSLDRDCQTLVLDNNGTVLFEDSKGRTDYKFSTSPDFGTTWSEINSGIIANTTLPGAQGIGSLEPNILLAPNGINVIVATTLTGLGEIAPVGTTPTADADTWGYFTSADQGATWTWTTIGVDGQEYTPGFYYLTENFGQVSAAMGNDGQLRAVTNGYAIRQDPDTSLGTIDVVYWDAVNGFKSLVNFDRNWDIINDEVIPRSFNASFSNAIGCSYPSIATSDDGQTILCTWTQPNFTETTIDTASTGRIWADMWYNVSHDGGATWDGATALTATTDRFETFGFLSKRLEVSANGYLARLLYISDSEPGQCPFDGLCSMQDVVYHEFEITGTGVTPTHGQVPARFALGQNYPNPFNPSTKITFSVPVKTDLNLSVYNVLGEKVATLVDGTKEVGTYTVDFAASNLPSGVYYYRLKSGSYSETKNMVVMK